MRTARAVTAVLIISGLFLSSCTTMATIHKKDPMQEWHTPKAYDVAGFCFVDEFEGQGSFWTSGVALDVRNRTHTKVLTIQGAAKADRNFGIFEVTCRQEGPQGTIIELRGVKDPSTTAMRRVIDACISGNGN